MTVYIDLNDYSGGPPWLSAKGKVDPVTETHSLWVPALLRWRLKSRAGTRSEPFGYRCAVR
jgi:hypothetical protein